jgi:hypothetical protein
MFVVKDVWRGTLYRYFKEAENAKEYCQKINKHNAGKFEVMEIRGFVPKGTPLWEDDVEDYRNRKGRPAEQ